MYFDSDSERNSKQKQSLAVANVAISLKARSSSKLVQNDSVREGMASCLRGLSQLIPSKVGVKPRDHLGAHSVSGVVYKARIL